MGQAQVAGTAASTDGEDDTSVAVACEVDRCSPCSSVAVACKADDAALRARVIDSEQPVTGVSVGSCPGIALFSDFQTATASVARSSKTPLKSFWLTFLP